MDNECLGIGEAGSLADEPALTGAFNDAHTDMRDGREFDVAIDGCDLGGGEEIEHFGGDDGRADIGH